MAIDTTFDRTDQTPGVRRLASVEPGAPAPMRTCIVKNETARRIKIERVGADNGNGLIIHPFGSRTISQGMLDHFDYEPWREQNLISVQEISHDDIELKYALPGCLMLLLLIFLLVSIPTAIFAPSVADWRTVGIGVAGVVILIVIGYVRAIRSATSTGEKEVDTQSPWRERGKQLLAWLAFLPSLIIVFTIGLGLPSAIVYFFAGGNDLLSQSSGSQLVVLGRGLQLGYIAIASTLPALMYFMFRRQRLEKLRDSFIREVMLLDPNVQTITEAKTKYGLLLDSMYGSATTPLDPLPIFVSTTLMTLGWMLTLLPIEQGPTYNVDSLITVFTPLASPLNYGFLGTYFFALNMVFRGYVRADLTTKTYTHISIRFLMTTILVWTVSSLPGLFNGEEAASSPGMLALAFVIGIFPDTGIALILDVYKKAFGSLIKTQEDHPLTNLEGINLYDRARLLEEGIENIQNLVYHNLIELIARTRIPTARLVDVFDQAILYLHLGLETDKVRAVRQLLREYGIRTATDVQEACKHPEFLELLKSNASDVADKLTVINYTLADEEWMPYLRQWRRFTTRVELVASVTDFYALDETHHDPQGTSPQSPVERHSGKPVS